MYRQFKLINSLNNEWELSSKQIKSFFTDPKGLGLQSAINISRYGEKANVNSEQFAFPNPNGNILFFDTVNADRYELYNDFVRFLTYSPLKLVYTIPTDPSEIYTLDCYVTSLQKGESSPDHMLECPIQFAGLSFWQGQEVTVSGSAASYQITNDGDVPVGFEITITGSLTDPYFTLDQDGVYGEAKFIGSFDSVFVNSKDGEQSVELVQNSAILPNPLAYQDLSISNGAIYVTFVKLARGTSTLSVSGGSVTIKYVPLYRSV